MRSIYFYLISILLIFTSCKEQAPLTSSMSGVWRSLGSGTILHIPDSTSYALYDVTSISCLPSRKGGLDEIRSAITSSGDTLSLLTGVISYQFTRIGELPELCTAALTVEEQNDIFYNWEVFAANVQEHYAFMKLNDVDWNELYLTQGKKLDSGSDEIDLYRVIEETLEALNDNHAYLEGSKEVYDEMALDLPSDEETPITSEDIREYGDFEVADMVARHHLQEDMTKDSWLIKWGRMTDEIGYVQVKSMWLYADLVIHPSLIDSVGYVDAYVTTFHQMYEGDYIEREVAGVARLMDEVMSDLRNVKSLVIDVRFNGGGQDAVSFEILRRLNDDKLQIATQRLKYGDKHSPTQALHIAASDNAFMKPVFVLTSRQTGSAAEAFAIATMAMPHVQRIGARTSGAMSTALEKYLPNGWAFSISNEIYMDNNGICYENIGVPVDYKLEYPDDRQAFFRSVAEGLRGDKEDILRAVEALSQ